VNKNKRSLVNSLLLNKFQFSDGLLLHFLPSNAVVTQQPHTVAQPASHSMSLRNVLITGATGQQGRALIAALRPEPDTEAKFHVLALTRSSTRPAAQKLALEKHVTVVEGDMMLVQSMHKIFEDAKENGGIWGVFCVIAFPGLGAKADGEEQQGKARPSGTCVIHSPLTESFRPWQTSHWNLEYLSSFTLPLNEGAINLTMNKSSLDKPK
jgi:hypothetical protein